MDETGIRRNDEIMWNDAPKLVLCTILTLPYLAACSEMDGEAQPPMTEQAREFNEEDKAAAQALSLGSGSPIAANTPYAKALLCRNAIEVFGDRFGQSVLSAEEQQRALEQAHAYYDSRLRDLASEEGRTTREIDRDLRQVAEQNADPRESAQTLLACLRELQQLR